MSRTGEFEPVFLLDPVSIERHPKHDLETTKQKLLLVFSNSLNFIPQSQNPQKSQEKLQWQKPKKPKKPRQRSSAPSASRPSRARCARTRNQASSSRPKRAASGEAVGQRPRKEREALLRGELGWKVFGMVKKKPIFWSWKLKWVLREIVGMVFPIEVLRGLMAPWNQGTSPYAKKLLEISSFSIFLESIFQVGFKLPDHI